MGLCIKRLHQVSLGSELSSDIESRIQQMEEQGKTVVVAVKTKTHYWA